MEDLLNQIGSRILSRRKQLRMTQEELAEKAALPHKQFLPRNLAKKHCARKILSVSALPSTSAPITCSLVKQMPVTIPYCSPKFQTFLPYNTAIWRI